MRNIADLITMYVPDDQLQDLDHLCCNPLAASQIMTTTEIARDTTNEQSRESYRGGMRCIAY